MSNIKSICQGVKELRLSKIGGFPLTDCRSYNSVTH